MTYLDLMTRMQAQTIDALKSAQDAQLAALRAARENAMPAATLSAAGFAGDAALALGCKMMATGIAYAQAVTATLGSAPAASHAPATAQAELRHETPPNEAPRLAAGDVRALLHEETIVDVAAAPAPPVTIPPAPADVVAGVIAAAHDANVVDETIAEPPTAAPRTAPKSGRKKSSY